MAIAAESVLDLCRRARAASLVLPSASTESKDEALLLTARLLRERTEEILAANATDVERGREAGLDGALLDRLSLDAARIEAMAERYQADEVMVLTITADAASRQRSYGLLADAFGLAP